MCLCWDTQGLIHRSMCVSNKCHDGEGAHWIWDMTWSHVTEMEKIKMRLVLMDRLHVWRASWGFGAMHLGDGEAWARLGPMDQRDGEEQVKSRSMNQERHVIIWSGSYHLMIVSVHWLHWHLGGRRRKWNCARQRYNYRAFYFTSHRYVEKFMTGFRIDSHTEKKGNLLVAI